MSNNSQTPKLSEVIDIHFLQKFQDVFASAMNVASITIDEEGPVTKPSNFTRFCIGCTRSTEEGLKRCLNCDKRWGKIAALKGEPVIYTCHSGLTDFAVPIIVGGKHIGSILGGQVLTNEANEEHFRKIATEIGFDEEKYIEAMKEIKVIPLRQVEAAAQLLFMVSNALSEIGHKNHELLKKTKKEKMYKDITEAARKSLEISQTKKAIVDIVCKTLNADRCFITDYDKENEKFLPVADEFLSTKELPSFIGFDRNSQAPVISEILKSGKPVIIKNKNIIVDSDDKSIKNEKIFLDKFNINSAYAMPIFYENEFLGVLSIHYSRDNANISDDDMQLVSIVTNQIALAMHQAKIYHLTQLQNEKEKINRAIVEILRSSLEKEKIEHIFVQNIGKYFNADRVYFSGYDSLNNCFLTVEPQAEYLSSIEVKSMVGENFCSEIKNRLLYPLLEKKEVKIPNVGSYIKEIKASNIVKDFFEAVQSKSTYKFPVLYQRDLMGYFCISFTKEMRNLTTDDLTLIRSICTQAGIAFFHSDLYLKVQNSSHTKEDFIANIAKEIKPHINKIVELSEKLTAPELEKEEKLEFLKIINNCGKRLLELRNDIITISHIESDNFHLNYSYENTEELFEKVLKATKDAIEEKQIQIEAHIQNANVNLDKEMLILALFDIIFSTVRLLPNDAKIIIKSSVTDFKLYTSIEIPKNKIPNEQINKIFEVFKQVDSHYNHPRQNSGLELLIAKRIIDKHMGIVKVESLKDNGILLSFYIPNAYKINL